MKEHTQSIPNLLCTYTHSILIPYLFVYPTAISQPEIQIHMGMWSIDEDLTYKEKYKYKAKRRKKIFSRLVHEPNEYNTYKVVCSRILGVLPKAKILLYIREEYIM